MRKYVFDIKKHFRIFLLTAICFSCLMPLFSVAAQTSKKSVSSKSGGKISKRKTTSARRVKRNVKTKQPMNQTTISTVAPGVWGAVGIALTVDENGARIEYDCASGEITQKLTIDAQGNFAANGTHTRQAPGPIRIGFEPKSQAARYEGKISDKTMTLTVSLSESQKLVGEWTLEQGKTPRLHRCY